MCRACPASPPVAQVRVPPAGSEERGRGPSRGPAEHRAARPWEEEGRCPLGRHSVAGTAHFTPDSRAEQRQMLLMAVGLRGRRLGRGFCLCWRTKQARFSGENCPCSFGSDSSHG